MDLFIILPLLIYSTCDSEAKSQEIRNLYSIHDVHYIYIHETYAILLPTFLRSSKHTNFCLWVLLLPTKAPKKCLGLCSILSAKFVNCSLHRIKTRNACTADLHLNPLHLPDLQFSQNGVDAGQHSLPQNQHVSANFRHWLSLEYLCKSHSLG